MYKPIHCRSFKTKHFSITELQKNNKYIKHQYVAYPQHKKKPLVFATDYIKLVLYKYFNYRSKKM